MTLCGEYVRFEKFGFSGCCGGRESLSDTIGIIRSLSSGYPSGSGTASKTLLIGQDRARTNWVTDINNEIIPIYFVFDDSNN